MGGLEAAHFKHATDIKNYELRTTLKPRAERRPYWRGAFASDSMTTAADGQAEGDADDDGK